MSKRDYYEVLGVGKQATAEEIKKAYRKRLSNIIPTKIRATKRLRRSLKKQRKLMKCSAMNKSDKPMIDLVMKG